MPPGSGSGLSPLVFKRAQRGLYGGKQRLTGNHVSPSKRHVRRVWLPNVQHKRLWSDIFGRHIEINVTTAVLRQVDTMGGVDNYLLYTKPEKLHSLVGMRLRKQLEDRIGGPVKGDVPPLPPKHLVASSTAAQQVSASMDNGAAAAAVGLKQEQLR